MKKRGFTLIELLVVVAIIAMLLAILMPALNKVKKIAQRVVCGTNLKGLGNAQVVYAHDYDGQYAVQGKGAAHTWADVTAGWQNPAKNWNTPGNISVGASLYLLVRQADVSPKSFVCPSSDQVEFTGKNVGNFDIVDLWDFGDGSVEPADNPRNCVSYSYHQPYMGTTSTGQAGRYRADDQRSAAFAMMADKNPWFDSKLQEGGANAQNWVDRVRVIGDDWTTVGTTLEAWNTKIGNAQAHEREGQNVLFADGHSSFEKRADVGVKNDNIYTLQGGTSGNPTEYRQGVKVTNKANVPLFSLDDSLLVNDDMR